MLCSKCAKTIPDDSRFCPYCAAEQPIAAPVKNTPPPEPYTTSSARRIGGGIVAALLLLALAGLVYILSANGVVFFPGWTAFNN